MHLRSFFKGTAAALLAAPFAASWSHASARTLAPVQDASTGLSLLRLPPGFSYSSFSWTGDSMLGGGRVPARHDGMAVDIGRYRDARELQKRRPQLHIAQHVALAAKSRVGPSCKDVLLLTSTLPPMFGCTVPPAIPGPRT